MIEKIPFLQPILPQLEWLHSKIFPAWYARSCAKAFVEFEQELLLLPLLVSSKDTVVDVGAHTGAYIWHLLKITNAIEAFEPNPNLVKFLDRAFKKKIRLHAVALSDQTDTAILEIPFSAFTHSFAPGEARLIANPPKSKIKNGNSFIVKSEKLDDFDIKKIGFIKIDVEGHELNVLRGCPEILRLQKPNLLIEAEERHKPGAVPILQAHLAQYGYNGYFLRHGQLCPIAAFLPEMQDMDKFGSVHSGAARNYINNFIFIHAHKSDDFEQAFRRHFTKQIAQD